MIEGTIIPHGGRLMTILVERHKRAGKRQPVFDRMVLQITATGVPRVIRSSLMWSRYELYRFLEERGVI